MTPELQARAVQIADSCMRSEVECTGVGFGQLQDHRYGLVDENCVEVKTLAEADWALREAFEYLRDRGLASLLPDDGYGEVIQLHVDRFAA